MTTNETSRLVIETAVHLLNRYDKAAKERDVAIIGDGTREAHVELTNSLARYLTRAMTPPLLLTLEEVVNGNRHSVT